MPPLKTSRHAYEVWRFQRDQIYPDVITGVTKDRKRWVFVTSKFNPRLHSEWAKRFGKRQTIYCEAIVGASTARPTVRVLREVEGW